MKPTAYAKSGSHKTAKSDLHPLGGWRTGLLALLVSTLACNPGGGSGDAGPSNTTNGSIQTAALPLRTVDRASVLQFPSLNGNIRAEVHMLPAVSTGPLDPDWSPDGRHIAFAMRGDIWVMPSEGGPATQVTEGPDYHFEPAWSPDGTQLALTVERDRNLEVGIVDASGGEVRVIASHPGVDAQPVWSADGEQIYFTSARDGTLDIHTVGVTTGTVDVVVGGRGNQIQPDVSPDGTMLVYVAPEGRTSGSGAIWVRAITGGGATLVQREETAFRTKPQWTPDGASILYVSDAGGNNDVTIVPAGGGNPLRLTQAPDHELDASVSPDGTRIAFVSNATGPTTLFTAPAAGGTESTWNRLGPTTRSFAGETGRVRLTVEGPDGTAVPARVHLRASDGRGYAPDDGFFRLLTPTHTPYFHTDGSSEVEVPAGPLTVEAVKGPEYQPASAAIEVQPGSVHEVRLRLERHTDAAALGWYGGDTHGHDLHQGRFGLDHDRFFNQLVAEDLRVTNALIHMDGTRLMGRWEDLTGSPHPLSTETHILQYAQEFRGSFGHVGMLGVSEFVMPLIGGATNTAFAEDVLNAHYLDAARSQGGLGGFMHPYSGSIATPVDVSSSEIPIDVALGSGDFYDVICFWYDDLNNARMYYKLLNAGVRLPATGGTDNFSDVWRDGSSGAARTYAKVEGGLTVPAWLDAVRAGRTFATNGPLLFLSVDGLEPGGEIAVMSDGPQTYDVGLEVASHSPLYSAEIIVNGEMVKRFDLDGLDLPTRLSHDITLDGPGWIAARVVGPSSRYISGSYAFAQTSPVYIVDDGSLFVSASDAEFLAETAMEVRGRAEARNRWHSTGARDDYLAAIDEAAAFYRQRAEAAAIEEAQARRSTLLDPSDEAWREAAPDTFVATFETSRGEFKIEVIRAWAPVGADRFYNLVRHGYYDDTRLHRVVPGFITQWGVSGDPAVSEVWYDRVMPDDPVVSSNTRGSIAYAFTDPGTRSTQVYINMVDNERLDAQGFAPFGRVITGMESVVDSIFSGYGEGSGGGVRRGDQTRLVLEGNPYLDNAFPRLDRILRGRVEIP